MEGFWQKSKNKWHPTPYGKRKSRTGLSAESDMVMFCLSALEKPVLIFNIKNDVRGNCPLSPSFYCHDHSARCISQDRDRRYPCRYRYCFSSCIAGTQRCATGDEPGFNHTACLLVNGDIGLLLAGTFPGQTRARPITFVLRLRDRPHWLAAFPVRADALFNAPTNTLNQ